MAAVCCHSVAGKNAVAELLIGSSRKRKIDAVVTISNLCSVCCGSAKRATKRVSEGENRPGRLEMVDQKFAEVEGIRE
jgi:hypothetical protein